jgi:type I restriction enzyme M protein
MNSANGHVQFIWGIAELLRGDYKQSEYGRVILPFTVLRRLDLVLAPTKQAVLDEAARIEGLDFDSDPLLRKAAEQRFYNTSELDLKKVAGDAANAAAGLRAYQAGFSPTVREIFDAFSFDQQITRLHKAGLLYQVLTRFLDADLHPDSVSNAQMGDVFEELIRRFSEASNETAGEHFTPREVVRLCAELVLAGDDDATTKAGAIRKVYDPACGTGGMLSVTEELVRERNPRARLYLYGQELNPESWAICRSEMLLKGQDPSNIYPRSTLSEDGLPEERFDLMLANPPFGVDWSKDQAGVIEERDSLGERGRFGAGTPPKNDGALLFLQTMLAKRKPADEGGTRIGIIFNGSPLFSGGAGSGPSEIRRWILENDWLEAIVALPEQLFYNTGIATYVWVLSNRKAAPRRGKVQLIDARGLWEPMPKSLGDKRRRLSLDHIDEIIALYRAFEEGERSEVRDNEFFMYRRITVERPLRLRYEVSEDAIERLRATKAFENLAKPAANAKDPAKATERGKSTQRAIIDGLRALNGFASTDRGEAETKVRDMLRAVERPAAALRKAVWEALSVRDPNAPVVAASDGAAEPDSELRDYENVPLDEAVGEFMEREVLPFVQDAWIDDTATRIGTEIAVTRLFYRRELGRPVSEIDADLREVEEKIAELRAEVEGRRTDLPRSALSSGSVVSKQERCASGLPWLPSIPSHWRSAKLSLVARLGTGHTPSRSESRFWEGERDIPWLTTGDIARFRDGRCEVLTETKQSISQLGLENSAAVLHPPNTVALSRTASVGFSVIMGCAMATSQDFATWTCSSLLEPRFLLLCLRAMREDLVGRLAIGSTHKTIYMPEIQGLRIPLPPIDEQRRIVDIAHIELRHLDRLSESVQLNLSLLTKRREALLREYVAGLREPLRDGAVAM